MIVELLEPRDGDLPGPLLTELAALYTSDYDFQQLSGEVPDPDATGPEQVAASLADELAHPGAEVLLARSAGRLVAFAVTRTEPGPAPEADPWIGLLMVHGELRRAGYGRQLAEIVEARFRDAGRTGVRLAVPEDNPGALAFWRALGYEEVAREDDGPHGRPRTVLRKDLSRT